MTEPLEELQELQAQLRALNKARAMGVTSTSYEANGTRRTTTWKSDIEMRGAQFDLQQRIAALQTPGAPRRVLIAPNKGLGIRRRGFGAWQATEAEKREFERNHRDD